jgi:hypothetical protein
MTRNGRATQGFNRRGQRNLARAEDHRRLDPGDCPANGSDKERSQLQLSEFDQRHLEAFQKQLSLVQDKIVAVVKDYSTGLFLHGTPGTSKTHTVMETLKELQANYKLFNSHMTGRGLYDTLEDFPDAIHVLEDMEQITHDRGAQGVLRSALWGQRRDGDRSRQERLVTWTTCKMVHSFYFTGGVIMISNRPLSDMPELQSLKTRIPCMRLQPNDNEMRALMRHVSLRGYEHDGKRLDPADCIKVCEYVIEESLSLHRLLDMRLLINSWNDFLQWEEGDSACHWRDSIAARVRERATYFRTEVSTVTRAARKQLDLDIVREIVQSTADRTERLRLFQERTGKSQPTFYRRLAELDGR